MITACGTSWHAGTRGRVHDRRIGPHSGRGRVRLRVPVPATDRSTDGTLVIAISQSGETADTLAAMREARSRGAPLMGIVNVVGSSIARETDGGVYIHSGPEIGVASTKAFTGQLTVLALFALYTSPDSAGCRCRRGREFVAAMRQLPDLVQLSLDESSAIERIAREVLPRT